MPNAEEHPYRPWIDRLLAFTLLLLAIALLTFDLGNVPLRDWDEGIVAQVAREIAAAPFESLTWLHPTLWGSPYWNKPPLLHGLVAIAYTLGGVQEWTARLPGALLTACSVPLLYGVGREVFYLRLPSAFAALVYLTSLALVRNGRLAMLDGGVVCFSLLMLLCLLRARRNYRYSLGVGLGLGLLCLTKGVMVAGLMGAIALLFLRWDTPRLLRLPYFWVGILVGCIPAAMWYTAQLQRYGQLFFMHHLLDQSAQRVWEDVENNQGPPWYYLLELVKYGVPWILFLPQGLQLAWKNRNLSWAKLAIVWSGLYFLAISLMATKLPWYILPLYPALSLIVGAQVATLWRGGKHVGIKQWIFKPYSPLWMGMFALLALVGWLGMLYYGWWSQPLEAELQNTLSAFALTMTVTAWLIARQNPQFLAVLIWGMYVSLMLFFHSPHWNWELAERYPVRPVAAIVQRFVPPGQEVYTSDPETRPSLNFYSDRPILPTPDRRLQRLWRRKQPQFFLLDPKAQSRLQLKDAKVLGQMEGWKLVTPAKSVQK
ncbi:MAG: glycosyltransferase family 39 protein [Oculatellaceae cyanobacterium Prado106]|jgi:4-amino-4-deoxy-L-arabinose transferase-like glycosyltransferase|nr:glycosyltransferase family 39 protein [Oculatellaceae cyanobacterium Prado106]